jgi:hypothetical protein
MGAAVVLLALESLLRLFFFHGSHFFINETYSSILGPSPISTC